MFIDFPVNGFIVHAIAIGRDQRPRADQEQVTAHADGEEQRAKGKRIN